MFFERLVAVRDQVSAALGRDASTLELSMGMSADLDMAVAAGSTNVRIGSAIFGARQYPSALAKPQADAQAVDTT